MIIFNPRILRERRTVEAMIDLYCHNRHHPSNTLCCECNELLEYAHARLTNCPFASQKPTCTKCPVHCYSPHMRERIRQVMRIAGPRMIWRHPALTMWHLIDKINRLPKSR